jgi:hypothetical protein
MTRSFDDRVRELEKFWEGTGIRSKIHHHTPRRPYELSLLLEDRRRGVIIGFGNEENTVGEMERPIAVTADATMLSPTADNAPESSLQDAAIPVPKFFCSSARRSRIRR